MSKKFPVWNFSLSESYSAKSFLISCFFKKCSKKNSHSFQGFFLHKKQEIYILFISLCVLSFSNLIVYVFDLWRIFTCAIASLWGIFCVHSVPCKNDVENSWHACQFSKYCIGHFDILLCQITLFIFSMNRKEKYYLCTKFKKNDLKVINKNSCIIKGRSWNMFFQISCINIF